MYVYVEVGREGRGEGSVAQTVVFIHCTQECPAKKVGGGTGIYTHSAH